MRKKVREEKKEISGSIKLQMKGGEEKAEEAVGPGVGQRGGNIMEWRKEFKEKRKT